MALGRSGKEIEEEEGYVGLMMMVSVGMREEECGALTRKRNGCYFCCNLKLCYWKQAKGFRIFSLNLKHIREVIIC